MSTGGGWQDQVGGLSMGLKYITAESGMHQYPKVQQIELKQETKDELNSRFALIYTGQRRLGTKSAPRCRGTLYRKRAGCTVCPVRDPENSSSDAL